MLDVDIRPRKKKKKSGTTRVSVPEVEVQKAVVKKEPVKEPVKEKEKDSTDLETAISMKRRMPDLGEIHYYFLHEMVESMEFDTWDTLVIKWKCGTENRVDMEYSSRFRIPGGEDQKKNIICQQWVEQAGEEQASADEESESTVEITDELPVAKEA